MLLVRLRPLGSVLGLHPAGLRDNHLRVDAHARRRPQPSRCRRLDLAELRVLGLLDLWAISIRPWPLIMLGQLRLLLSCRCLLEQA